MSFDAHAELAALAWPAERAAEALVALARAAGLHPTAHAAHERASHEGVATLSERLHATAEECGIEVEALETKHATAGALLARAAPVLLRLEASPGDVRLLALLRGGRRGRLLAPDGTRRACDTTHLCELWCAPHERILDPLVTGVLDAAGLQGAARTRARAALVAEHLVEVPVGGAWALRSPASRPFLATLRQAGLARLAAVIALCGFGASTLGLLSWIPFGRGVLEGRFEPAWFVAWALLLASTLPLRWLEGWLQSLFGVRFGVLLRRRLMAGATRLELAAVRGEGAGALLGRVLDSEALEALLLSGGFVLLGAAIDVTLAGWVLSRGPSAAPALVLFALCALIALAFGLRHQRRARAQADARLALTRDLVERMQGQRTRVVQEPEERWHLEEDALLESYLARSRALDGAGLALATVVSGAWLVAGAALVTAPFVSGASTSRELALGIGALLLGQQALQRLCSGLAQLSACAVAWRQVRPLYHAAGNVEEPGLPRAALRPGTERADAAPPLLAARELCFKHEGREREVLGDVSFELHEGERVLVEGPSGGGKSTLVSLLAGWRTPRDGALLLNGLDRASQGAARWRRHVAAAPQFHENHVFTGTMAFNLLLAARVDADVPLDAFHETAQARAEARALEVCAELGLDELLARMPSGLRQVVGETGWQLSHGEKSRLFVARALLADASLVLLDESLAALDPETATRVLECTRRRAKALVVVAHP